MKVRKSPGMQEFPLQETAGLITACAEDEREAVVASGSGTSCSKSQQKPAERQPARNRIPNRIPNWHCPCVTALTCRRTQMPPKESSPARMGSMCESETERVQILLISKNVLQIGCTCRGDAVQNSAICSEIQFQQDIELSMPIGAAQHRIMLHTPSRF